MSILSGTRSAFSGSDPTKRNVILLSLCLAFSMSGTSLNMVISALTGKMLADPNASRCATALWLQRREIEELGLAKPGDWGTSVGVTLI